MGLTRRVVRWGSSRLSRRLTRSVPLLGGLLAVATVGAAMRRKGVVRGVTDTALDAMPFVGAAKLLVETLRGRDLIAARTSGTGSSRAPTQPAVM
jgi:hypothetical protein